MKRLLSGVLVSAALGAVMVWGSVPAAAQIARSPAALGIAGMGSKATEVQYRYARRGYYRGRYYRHRGPGPGVAAGIVAGAIIGGAIAAQQGAARAADADAYCASRYRSYDPASGTYLGYDGLRHPCP